MAKKIFVLAFLGFLCAMGLPVVNAAAPFAVSASTSALAAGTQAKVSVNVTASAATVSNAIVDVEIYDASGNRSFQQFFDNQNLPQGATENYGVNWTPSAAGTYTLKAGVFGQNWSSLLDWENNLATLTVSAVSQAPQFGATAAATPVAPLVNQSTAIAANVSATGALTGGIVDIEIYNASGQQMFQKFFTQQNFSAGGTNAYSASWTPSAAGAYAVKIGVFNGDWSHLYYWTDTAASVNVQTPAPTPTPSVPAPAPTAAFAINANAGTLSVNQSASIPVAVTNNAATVSNAIVDVEIYDASGNRSFQQFFDNQNLPQGATENYGVNWTPSAAGTYTLKAGVFGQNWSSLIYWSDTVATLSAGTVSVPPTPTPPVVTSGDPISGVKLYVDPESPAATQIATWNSTDPTDAQHLKVIAANSEAEWFGNWNTNVTQDVKTFVDAAANANAVPTLVAYNIPQRDCGGYSAGGSDNPDGYKTWMDNFAIGIGNRKAIVILEPDALAQISCLSSTDQATRLSLLSYAVQKLKSLGNTSVYIDAGNPDWISANDMSSRLSNAGIAQADGFSLNVSNFYTNADNISYGTTLSSQVGGKHFVIDTSRNGNGSDGEWCNPSGRALGTLPTAITGNSLVDAFLWIKRPGESDGTCNGGPSAGTWWPQYAVGLAANAGY